jgi:iron-sulfur cluster repair protein YtfE (RIC family)
MKPGEARTRLLEDHARLRVLLSEAEEVARRFLDGAPLLEELRLALGLLRATLAEHNRAEEKLLEPMLRDAADTWGPARVSRMLEEHVAEHGAIRALLEGDELAVARLLPDFGEELMAHMAAEERTFLHPSVLPDASRH